MKIGTKIGVDGALCVAVYDNTTKCDRCDLFDPAFHDCLANTTLLKDIDCDKDKLIFKLILDKPTK